MELLFWMFFLLLFLFCYFCLRFVVYIVISSMDVFFILLFFFITFVVVIHLMLLMALLMSLSIFLLWFWFLSLMLLRLSNDDVIIVLIVVVFDIYDEEESKTAFHQAGPSVSKTEAYGAYARGRPGLGGGVVASVAGVAGATTAAAAAAITGNVVDSFGKEGSSEAGVPTQSVSALAASSHESGTNPGEVAPVTGEVELEAPAVEAAPPSQESLSNGITFHIPDDDIVKRTAALISTVTIEDPKSTAETTHVDAAHDEDDDDNDEEEGAGSSV